MAGDESGSSTTRSVDAAFDAPGNETRMEIRQTLAEDDGRLSFSELRECAECVIRDRAD